jgi:uncharacterized membrane protein YfcA
MAHIDLVNMPGAVIAAIVMMLVIAGMTKGLIGIGMPIVAVPLLNLVVDLPVTVAILSIPLIISNVPQALQGDRIGVVTRRLFPLFCGLVFGVGIGVYLLASVRVDLLKPIVGVILIAVVSLMLLSPRLVVRPKQEKYLGPLAGLIGGILGGLAALAGPFVFVYILALGLTKDRFVQYSSLYLVVASTLLTILLGGTGALGWKDALASTLAVVPILVGMRIGAGLRTLVSPPVFRTLILAVVMVSGLQMVAGSFTSVAAAMHHLVGERHPAG